MIRRASWHRIFTAIAKTAVPWHARKIFSYAQVHGDRLGRGTSPGSGQARPGRAGGGRGMYRCVALIRGCAGRGRFGDAPTSRGCWFRFRRAPRALQPCHRPVPRCDRPAPGGRGHRKGLGKPPHLMATSDVPNGVGRVFIWSKWKSTSKIKDMYRENRKYIY